MWPKKGTSILGRWRRGDACLEQQSTRQKPACHTKARAGQVQNKGSTRYTFVLGQNKMSKTFANFGDLARFGMIVSVPLLFHHGVSVPDFKAMAQEFHVCQLCCLIWPLGQQILRTVAELGRHIHIYTIRNIYIYTNIYCLCEVILALMRCTALYMNKITTCTDFFTENMLFMLLLYIGTVARQL